MRGCTTNEKTKIGFFRLEKKRCHRLPSRPTRSVNHMLHSVIWTEFQGENRLTWCFHLLFHPSFHLAAPAKVPQNSQLACGSVAFGDGRGDGKRAVATPLFDGNCRPGALQVPRGFASLQGRHRPFPVFGVADVMVIRQSYRKDIRVQEPRITAVIPNSRKRGE